MPHDRGALMIQLRALRTHQRFSSVVIHNYCRSAEHFLEHLAQRGVAVDAATPDHDDLAEMDTKDIDALSRVTARAWRSSPAGGSHRL
jgi:hypothetical protein